MNRRSLPIAAALTAAAALLLTACGGSDDKSNDKIAGVDQGDKKPASPSATTPPDTAGRPSITFPADAKNVFVEQETGDPKKDEVLADNAQRINSVDDAIFRGSVNTQALSFYSVGKALPTAISFVQGYVDKEYTWTGETRYFDRKVTFLKDGTASVIYCSDESRSFLKNRKTGKINNTPTSADSYVIYNTQLAKNEKGVWQTTNVISKRGAKECQP